jgi:hypothetical protein
MSLTSALCYDAERILFSGKVSERCREHDSAPRRRVITALSCRLQRFSPSDDHEDPNVVSDTLGHQLHFRRPLCPCLR